MRPNTRGRGLIASPRHRAPGFWTMCWPPFSISHAVILSSLLLICYFINCLWAWVHFNLFICHIECKVFALTAVWGRSYLTVFAEFWKCGFQVLKYRICCPISEAEVNISMEHPWSCFSKWGGSVACSSTLSPFPCCGSWALLRASCLCPWNNRGITGLWQD